MGLLPEAPSNFEVYSPSVFWQDRIATMLAAAGPRCHIECDRSSGIKLALNRLAMSDIPLVTLNFDEQASSQMISTKLANSVQRTLGVRLVLDDAPHTHNLAVLSRELVRLGPVRFAVIWSDYCIELVEELGRAFGNQNQVISLSYSSTPTECLSTIFRRIPAEVVRMSDHEALVAAGDSMNPEDAITLAKECGYLYGEYLSRIDPTTLVSSEIVGGPQANSMEYSLIVSDASLLDVLIDRGRWIEAFELACRKLPQEVRRVVILAGHQLVDLGAFEYMWDGLWGLPEGVKQDPDVAYWLIVAASATNRVHLVRKLADEVLSSFEAPDLRAAVAVLHPTVDMVSETARAVKAMETPTTLRAMGFALAYAGDRTSPVQLFRRAMARAESLRANHLVIACAIDIANQEITLGRYQNGVDWARWAVQELDRRRSNEQFRRHAALAQIAYGTILTGDDNEVTNLRTLISSLCVDWTRIGAPTYESVVSTAGDWYFASGSLGTAEEHYRRVLEGVPLSQYASAALDVVKVLIAQGKLTEAHSLAKASRTLTATSTPTERALADLAMGMVSARSNLEGAQQFLRSAQAGLAGTNYVVFEAQSFLWMALAYHNVGRTDLAASMLSQGAQGIAELGPTGWSFLLCNATESSVLRELWHSSSTSMYLQFLGVRQVFVNGVSTRASMRNCEVLAALSENVAGVNGEKLRLMVFGDESTAANTKATVSRMRRSFPISQSPYRLTGRVHTDFGDLIRAVEKGDLTKALNLYGGQLLPGSEAPWIVEMRSYVDEGLKAAVIASNDVELMIRLGTIMDTELEIWERAKALLSSSDNRRGLINARIRRIRAYLEI